MKKRASGLLLHVTSLPSEFGIGGFGPLAYRFIDFLYKAKQSYWQILPLNPPHDSSNISPYDCLSAFAGNTNLISPRLLYKSGYLRKKDINNVASFKDGVLDYRKAAKLKSKMLVTVYDKFKTGKEKQGYKKFCLDNKNWLDDYVLFIGLSSHFKTADWAKWPKEIRDRKKDALRQAAEKIEGVVEKEKISQYIFFKQWLALKKYANQRGISIIGDMPIYVAYQSADVWAHQDIFKLDRSKKPVYLSGVPPDLFSKTGQLWGNPVYKWDVLKKRNYNWWIERMRQNLNLYDMVRIDHFRGLVKFWQVSAGEKTAVKGKWIKGPGEDLFKTIYKYFPSAKIIAEDLGYITPDVREVVKNLNLPCMKVLLFAFSDMSGTNQYLPHHHIENCIVYTGTHDNNTVKGWFEKDAKVKQKKALFAYLGRNVKTKDLPRELVRMAMASVGETVIIPMQDVLGLGSEARMNRPAKKRGNWKWRLKKNQLSNELAGQLAKITELYGRT